jgi:hypothetical protein
VIEPTATEQIAALATELVALKVDLSVAVGLPEVAAAFAERAIRRITSPGRATSFC